MMPDMNSFLAYYRAYVKRHIEDYGYPPPWPPEFYYDWLEKGINERTGEITEDELQEAVNLAVESEKEK